MKRPRLTRWRSVALLPLVAALALPLTAPLITTPARAADPAATALPDPMTRGTYTPMTIQETKLGLASLEEPNSSGAAPTAGTAQAPETFQIRGALYYPADRAEPSPLIVLVLSLIHI